MKPPENIDQYLEFISIETARMSWPGSMMQGKKQILKAGAPKAVEKYFKDKFPIRELWDNPDSIANDYDKWHCERSKELSEAIKNCKGYESNILETVAAKLLDTYMHQLMKHPKFRSIYPKLHLPLDGRAFRELKKEFISFCGKDQITDILEKSPYMINRDEYEKLQEAMTNYIKELQAIPNTGIKWSSRIELNWLWI